MTIENSTTGVAKNPFRILDAVDYVGPDGYVEYNSDARDNNVVVGVGDDKVIFDTDYFEVNELVGLHQISIRWWMSVCYLKVRYYWLNPDGEEGYHTINIDNGTDDPNYGFGIIGNFFFEENYQYRIQIRTEDDDDYPHLSKAYLDYVTLTPINVSNPQNNFTPRTIGYNEYYTSNNTTTFGNYVQVERFGMEEVVGTGTTSKEVTIQLYTTPALYFPIATMYSRDSGYSVLCTIEDINTTNFVVRVYLAGGATWSQTFDIIWKASCLEDYTILNDDLLVA